VKDSEQHLNQPFPKNTDLDKIIVSLSGYLRPLQTELEKNYLDTRWPVGFIVGNTRGGTTLLTQWLASLKIFGYPSNLLTRFAYSPHIGALIQKMLFQINDDFHNKTKDLNQIERYNSDLGKSVGLLGVNEFQHFFRNYMPVSQAGFLDDTLLKKVNFLGIKKGLASIEDVLNKPFIMKAAMFKYNVIELANELRNSIYIRIIREPIYTMQSIYFARLRFFGNHEGWFGSQPKEYFILKNMNIYYQIAGQVFFTEKSLNEAFEILDENRKVVVQYENFCLNPITTYDQIKKLYTEKGVDFYGNYSGPIEFENRNIIKIESNHIDSFLEAYNYFANNYS